MFDQTTNTIFVLLTAVAACTPPDTLDVESTDQASTNFNGTGYNGTGYNGTGYNGTGYNGTGFDGLTWTSLEGVSINGTTLDVASLSATVFSGTAGSTQFTGSDFVGAEFEALRGNGDATTVRIVSATSGSKWSYFVEYLEDDDWYPICVKDGAAIAAYAMNGRWNYQSGVGGGAHVDDTHKFTFACTTTGALGKCVNDGYEPWASGSLANYHQACVRMLRADYCGDGTSYTTNGRLVNLYDGIGIQSDTEEFGMEAEWDQNGARCVTSHHRASVEIPCYDPELEPACGQLDHFQSGTLIMNEIP